MREEQPKRECIYLNFNKRAATIWNTKYKWSTQFETQNIKGEQHFNKEAVEPQQENTIHLKDIK